MIGLAIGAACLAGWLGYLIGFRAGDLHGRPSWDEKRAREEAAWQDGVAWGRYLETHKAELGL